MGDKIIRLTAENVKRLVAVEITPDGNVVEIAGANGAGKSSVLDAIAMALGGKRLIPPKPIREGEKRASIEVDLGDLRVRRTFTAAGSRIEVTNADGAKYPSPQAILDRLVGSLAFDPMEFCRSAPRDQVAMLRDVTGLDFASLDEERSSAYDARADHNRRAKQLEGQLAGIPVHEDVPDEEVDAAELLDELERIEEHNRQARAAAAGRDRARAEVSDLEREIEQLRERLAEMEDRLEDERRRLMDAEAKASGIEELDAAPVKEKLAGASEINRKIRENGRRAEIEVEIEAERAKALQLSGRIREIDGEKQRLLAESDLPIDGLSFDADGVYYQGVPLEQASQSEQIRVSLALGLALHPELRVMLIRDGSLLDDDAMAAVAEHAQAVDAQVWIERVGQGSDVAVVIEDGMVAPKDSDNA